jgi:hypothetical protein
MRKYLFADEAGDFEFARKQNVSRYFILCTVTMDSCALEHQLIDLRRELAWRGNTALGDYFHACEDNQCIRNLVFALLNAAEMRIDATILEKSKAQPQTRSSHARFYQYAWYYHLRSIGSGVLRREDELLLTAASLGRKRERGTSLQLLTMLYSRWLSVIPGLRTFAQQPQIRACRSRTTARGLFNANGSVTICGRMI